MGSSLSESGAAFLAKGGDSFLGVGQFQAADIPSCVGQVGLLGNGPFVRVDQAFGLAKGLSRHCE